MIISTRFRRSVALSIPLLAACGDGPTEPVVASAVEIRVHVTGGFAPTDYTILVDGASGTAVGETCASGCDFDAGTVLLGLAPGRIQGWARRLLDAGIAAPGDRDYGVECCDQNVVRLEYRDGSREGSVSGTLGRLPDAFAEVASELRLLAFAELPILVDFDADVSTLPADPLFLSEVRLDAASAQLELHVEYAGGCEHHAIDLVAVGGWMETDPVQVLVAVTHDARGDTCEALIRDTLVGFRLEPLRQAYATAYPGQVPGTRRFVMNLVWPGGTGPGVPIEF